MHDSVVKNIHSNAVDGMHDTIVDGIHSNAIKETHSTIENPPSNA